MKNSKFLAILHFLILAVVIWWNYYINSGSIDGKTVGAVSDKFSTLFTPAAYAFSIWRVIYLLLTCYAVYLIKIAFSNNEDEEVVLKSAPWLILAHLGSASWLWFWLQESTGISVIVMIVIMLSLIVAILKLNMERWDAPLPTLAFVWWPIDLYAGWISVALVANVSAHLTGIGWDGGLKESSWVIIMIAIVSVIHILMIQKRNMREFAAVAIWAFIAIAVKHWDGLQFLSWTAIFASIIIGAVAARHAYLNRATLPFIRKDNV
ncbi:MAG: tryptophan-rich sensory protein [Vicingaceae bacterium]